MGEDISDDTRKNAASLIGLAALGNTGATFNGIEKFNAPAYLDEVELRCDEVTAVCPVTGQPDQYVLTITYIPGCGGACVESKSLKLYLQTFRSRGIFVEALAAEVASEIAEAISCDHVEVIAVQKSRGGISITATATAISGDDDV